jgi:hypothetical protein
MHFIYFGTINVIYYFRKQNNKPKTITKMKKQINILSLKTFVLTVVIAAMLSTCILAQPNPENNTTEMASLSKLEKFMKSTEQSIKYIATDTALEENVMVEVADKENNEAILNLERLAWNIENALKYRAPSDNRLSTPLLQGSLMTIHERSNRPVKIEFDNTSKDAWLINAGYYKTTRVPLWNKVKKIFSARLANSELADKD